MVDDSDNDEADYGNDDEFRLESAEWVFCDAGIVSKVEPWPDTPEIHEVENTLMIQDFLFSIKFRLSELQCSGVVNVCKVKPWLDDPEIYDVADN